MVPRPANPITLCDGHGVGFVTVTGDPESTTQIYTLLADKIADDEIRAARRRRDTRR